MAIQIWDAQAGQYKSADLARFGGSGTLTEALVWDGTQYVKVWPVGGGALWSDDFDTSDTTLWDNNAFGGVYPWHNNGEIVNSGVALMGLKPVPEGTRVDFTLGSGVEDGALGMILTAPDGSQGAALVLSTYGQFLMFGETENLQPSPLEPGDVLSIVRDAGWLSVLVNDEPAPNNEGLSSESTLRIPDPFNNDPIVAVQQFFPDTPNPTVSRVQALPN